MKKLLVMVMFLGILTGGAAFSQTNGIAVVDVQKVVMNSAKVKKLEADRMKQEQDLQKFMMDAKKSMDAQKDEAKKKELQEKLNKELSQKLSTTRKDVIERTKTIENEILDSIQKEAKKMGYDIVISKTSVLYGGNDITEDIIKRVK